MSGRNANEERVRLLALEAGGPMLYAIVRALQRVDVDGDVGYVGDADVLSFREEGQRLVREARASEITDEATLAAAGEKRGPGRPRGSTLR